MCFSNASLLKFELTGVWVLLKELEEEEEEVEKRGLSLLASEEGKRD